MICFFFLNSKANWNAKVRDVENVLMWWKCTRSSKMNPTTDTTKTFLTDSDRYLISNITNSESYKAIIMKLLPSRLIWRIKRWSFHRFRWRHWRKWKFEIEISFSIPVVRPPKKTTDVLFKSILNAISEIQRPRFNYLIW